MVQHEVLADDIQAVVRARALGDGDDRAEAGPMPFGTEPIERDARMQGGLLSAIGDLVGGDR